MPSSVFLSAPLPHSISSHPSSRPKRDGRLNRNAANRSLTLCSFPYSAKGSQLHKTASPQPFRTGFYLDVSPVTENQNGAKTPNLHLPPSRITRTIQREHLSHPTSCFSLTQNHQSHTTISTNHHQLRSRSLGASKKTKTMENASHFMLMLLTRNCAQSQRQNGSSHAHIAYASHHVTPSVSPWSATISFTSLPRQQQRIYLESRNRFTPISHQRTSNGGVW